MATLTKEANRAFELGTIGQYPVAASTKIYQGAAVGLSNGYARPLQAGDRFLGFAEATVDNTEGSAGAKDVRVQEQGKVKLPIAGVLLTDVGKAVYASDDDTFTLTQSTNSHIGRVVRFEKTGWALVEFAAHRAGLGGAITELTDNSGGSASDTIEAIADSATKNAIASLVAKVNQLIRSHG